MSVYVGLCSQVTRGFRNLVCQCGRGITEEPFTYSCITSFTAGAVVFELRL